MPNVRVLLALSCLAFAARADDAAALKARGIDPTGPAVLAYITKRTPTPEVSKKIDTFLKQLEDDEQEVREKATAGLVELGALARGRLAEAMKSGDAEVRKRARQALEKIGPAEEDTTTLPAAARLLAAKKQAGALDALLAFLPHVESPGVADEMAAGLAPLAVDKDGKPEAAALRALSSKSAVVRHAAGQALARSKEGRAAARKLLEDASPGVRRRVALALLEARDKEAIPALVALTGSDSHDDAGAAEDALAGLAGEKAPEAVMGHDAKARARTKAAWEKWWKDAEGKFDLAKADLNGPGRGMSLLGVQDIRTGTVKIFGTDAGGTRKFTIEGMRAVTHASMARRDRVLVCEPNMRRVVEMDIKGKTHWTREVNQPLCAYRLRNGQTFIASRNQLLVLDRGGKEARRINRAASDVASAFLFDDGTVSLLTTNGTFQRLDKDGKQLSSVSVGAGRFFSINGMKCHFAADGSFVVPDYSGSMVRSYDKDGKLKWETRVTRPLTVTALPGGNLLVTPRLLNQTMELDKGGKIVKTTNVAEGRPVFFDRR